MWSIDPAWVGFGGTAISALIAATAYAWKGWQERKRTARRVLYHLLEFHYLTSKLNTTTTFPERYLAQVESKFLAKGSKLSPQERALFLAQMRSMLFNVAADLVRSLTQQMSETYLKSLEELSKDKPVLAHRLKGAEKVDFAETLVRSIECTDASGEPQDLRADAVFLEVYSHIQRDLILNLERSCRLVAFNCSLWTYLQTHLLLKQRSSHDEDTEIDRAIEKMLEGPLKQLQKQTALASLSA